MNIIQFEIKSPEHAQLAAEFMRRYFEIDNPELAFHNELNAEVKQAAQQYEAAVKTEQVIEKAAAIPVTVTEECDADHNIEIADLQALASAKSSSVGAAAVKAAISGFGAARIKDIPESRYPEIKAALEAL